MKHKDIFYILILGTFFSCTIPKQQISVEKAKLNVNDSIVIKKSEHHSNDLRFYNGKRKLVQTDVIIYRNGIAKEILTHSEDGILERINMHDSTITGKDTVSNRTYQTSAGQTMLFDKKGRLMFQFYSINFSVRGLCFYYSNKGQLNAIYNFEHNKLVNVVYTRHEKFRNVDSLFSPYRLWITER